MKILGVDPGGAGALALLDGTDLVDVADMPVFEITRNRSVRKELDVHELIRLLNAWAPDCCWFERVNGMEGDSPSSAFQFGRVAGMCEALVKAHGARFEFVGPPVWKKAMGLVGAAKDDSRVKAVNRWPAMASHFARKKDDGRAEAALIAEYGRREMLNEGIFG